MFFKELSRFSKIFSAKNAKKIFRSKKILLGLKNQVIGVRSEKNYRYESLSKYTRQKNGIDQKNLRENEVKYCNFTNFGKFRG